MSEEEKPPAQPEAPRPEIPTHEALFPGGHNFDDEVLTQWISIPFDEPVVIGPLTRRALDNLLFSTTDISGSIASLRSALVSYTNKDLETANKHVANSMAQLVDGETRNRLLFEAIMKSVIEVRKNAGK